MKITYDDYLALFPNGLSGEEFDSLLPQAAAFVDVITAGRADSASGYKAERAKMAVCAAVNELAAQNAARGADGARISAVSNDGYSENYGGLNTAESEEAALRSAVIRYLSGTGLVSAL